MIEPVVAPLDAYETAKPDEPTWTVQGGDPLGPHLLRLWAILARLQAGAGISQRDNLLDKAKAAAIAHASESNRESKALLIRATETEKISWLMDEYQKGIVNEVKPVEKLHNEFERLDVYDIRRRLTSIIHSFFADLKSHRQELLKHKFLIEGEELDNEIFGAILALKSILAQIEIRRRT